MLTVQYQNSIVTGIGIVLSPPTINCLPKSNTLINNVASTWCTRIYMTQTYLSSSNLLTLSFSFIWGPFYFNAMIVSMKKLATSLKAFIIWPSTPLFWLETFKRSLKLLFTDDQVHTSLGDEILMKNWPKPNNATETAVIYLKFCLASLELFF